MLKNSFFSILLNPVPDASAISLIQIAKACLQRLPYRHAAALIHHRDKGRRNHASPNDYSFTPTSGSTSSQW
jgi:hypothetical protein